MCSDLVVTDIGMMLSSLVYASLTDLLLSLSRILHTSVHLESHNTYCITVLLYRLTYISYNDCYRILLTLTNKVINIFRASLLNHYDPKIKWPFYIVLSPH